jgi:hypothetical protein
MALKSTEKQQRYRQRHLVHGNKQRLQLFIGDTTKLQLVRLAGYHNCTLTKLIEKLAAEADLAMCRRLPAELVDYYLKPEYPPRRLEAQPTPRSARRAMA